MKSNNTDKNKGRYVADEDYHTCGRTYVSLCIYHDSADPQTITDLLNIEPDDSHKVGDLLRKGKKAERSFWRITSKDVVEAKDVRVHLDWLLDELGDNLENLRKLKADGYEFNIPIFWELAYGISGGPIFDHEMLCRLSQYPFDMDIDIYFNTDNMLQIDG